MIGRVQIKEISSFVATFLEILDSFSNGYTQDSIGGEPGNAQLGRVLFSVSGAIEGYLLATVRQYPEPGQDGRQLMESTAAEIAQCYTRNAESSTELSTFRIKLMDTGSIDELLYSTRKTEPQMTVRIQAKRCAIELYAFTDSKKPEPE